MRFGCIGENLPHSFSKIIHEKIGKYPYELIELSPDQVPEFLSRRAFDGINVTIPYKQTVIPYLARIDPAARRIGAVNTVVNRNGELFGYNTDYAGLLALARRTGIGFAGKKVLIAGTGGTSKTALCAALDQGAAEVIRVSRTGKDGAVTYEEAYVAHKDAQILINTTPCGMFPRAGETPLDPGRFPALCGVLDAVYNPLRTEFVLSARALGIPAAGGLYMLVAQAVAAAELFSGQPLPEDLTDRIYREVHGEKENIVLIGMPSCGKTTVGRLLAARTGRTWIDADAEITRCTGMTPAEWITSRGAEAFRDEESRVAEQIAACSGIILSTGGGTVLRERNVRALRRNGRLYWLDRPCELLTPTPDRPLTDSAEKLRRLYAERRGFYEAAADLRLSAEGTPEECAAQIERMHNQ